MTDGVSVSWWQRLASLAKILFWVVLVVVVLQQVYGTFLRIPDAAWTRYGFGYTP